MTLSIVTTLFRSAGHIREFHRRVTEAAARVTADYEIIMVCDGSPDDSLEQAVAIAGEDSRVAVVELSRNFGHHKAMMTGLEHARGDLVFLIDSDLEEDPAWLSRFRETLIERQADVVYGFQESRKGPPLARLGGAVHWWIIGALSTYPIPRNLVTVRLMRSDYVRALIRHREQRTAIGGLWAITGFRQVGLPVEKAPRTGTSYPVGRRMALALDGVTSFSERPLMLVFFLGMGIFVASVVGVVYLVWLRLTGNVLGGWTSVLVSVWMLGGLSIASIGILGLYIGRIFIETKQRPYTIVRQIYGAQAACSHHGHSQPAPR